MFPRVIGKTTLSRAPPINVIFKMILYSFNDFTSLLLNVFVLILNRNKGSYKLERDFRHKLCLPSSSMAPSSSISDACNQNDKQRVK